jgi:hypothetical protein|tara:strand:+ start:3727 stop:4161 length:435 start_codon:yes stop_codon:yes gene_type:complete
MADLTQSTIGGGSSVKVAENRKPYADMTAIHYNGNKSLTVFEVACGAAVNAQTGSGLAIESIMRIVEKYCTVVIRGALYGTNQKFALIVEQPNDSLDYDGAGAETLVEQIEDEIIALGDLSSATPAQIDFTGATCTVKTTLELA